MEITKYELSRLMGARALQLSCMAPPLVKATAKMSFLDVAELEYKQKVIPLVVFRKKTKES
ncbi:MAG: DNA-directed RNA polymerase subunit K [Candidatus Micrarchaeota archaeon]